MYLGLDVLGGARYKDLIKKEFPRNFMFGIFAEVDGFGKSYDLIEWAASVGVPAIRVQLMWKDLHNFSVAKDLKAVSNRAAKVNTIIQKYPKVDWFISPCCEHELNENTFEVFASAVKRAAPKAAIVNSPNKGKGFVSRAYINEYHHEAPRKGGICAFSYDGANMVDSNITKDKTDYQAANAVYFLGWNSQCNGNRKIFKPGDKRQPNDFKDRAKRVFWPVAKQFDSWIWQLTKQKGAVNEPKGWTLKSHGDQHKVPPEGKDQKPVWIFGRKVSKITIKATNGQVVGEAGYFGTFSGGGYRYYFTQWGFELAQKAIRIAGNAVCDIFIGGKKVGSANPAFRGGNYR
jgi:hypothetical protein